MILHFKEGCAVSPRAGKTDMVLEEKVIKEEMPLFH